MCSISVCPSFLPSLFLLLFAASPLALGSKHLDKAPAGLRPAKAVDEQPGSGGGEPNTEPIPFGLVHNESTRRRSPVVFRKHRVHPPADSPTPSIHLTAISESEGTTTPKETSRVIVPPPAGKDYGLHTALQTNLVDSKGHVFKGVSAVPIRVTTYRRRAKVRGTASQVETGEEEGKEKTRAR